MKYSVVKFDDIDLGNRIDAEYFEPEYLKIFDLLQHKNSKKLLDYCDITASAFYPAATDLYKIGDIPFIRCVDCVTYPSITENQNEIFEKIPKIFFQENDNIKELKQNEIVITKVGTPCYASLLVDYKSVALSRTVLGLVNIKNVNPYYLTIFLRSRYGFLQLIRERELTIQYQLTLERVGNIYIYLPEIKFQNLIENLFKSYVQLNKKSQFLYQQAEELLLEELGLLNWKPKHKLYSIKNYSDVEEANRIDAEYFQPKYDELINTITQYSNGFDKLSNIVDIKKNIEVGSEEYVEKGIPFVRVSNLTKTEINDNNLQYITEKLYDNLAKVYQPQKGEILLSKDGTAGIAFYIDEQPKNMILSGGILRLKIKNKEYLPEYLTLVLNSLIVQQQVERVSSGALIKHWLIDEVNTTLIPKLDINKQKEIVGKIQESSNCRKQSKQLLEIAKRGVEIAIEENEETATNWINNELSKIGVEL